MAEILPFPKNPVASQESRSAAPVDPAQPSKPGAPNRGRAAGKAGRCPVCRKASQDKYRPFCSTHCWQVDLGRWFNGSYRVETEEAPSQIQSDADDAPFR